MSTFNYQVYLKKYIEVQSRVTTIGPSGQALIKTCKSPMLLSEEIVSGFVQGKDELEAVSLAQDELEKRYARASGYNGHEHVKVKKVDALLSEDEEEQEWDTIASQPHVNAALRRLAQEALQEHQAGKTESGGFGLEEEQPS